MPAALALSKYSSGKPCKRQHSRGVNRLIRIFSSSSATPCLSCAVKVKLGSPGSFIRLPFCRFFSRSGVSTAQQGCFCNKLLRQLLSSACDTSICFCSFCPLILMQTCNGVDFATVSAGARPWLEYTLPPCPCPQGLVLPIHLTAYKPVLPPCPPLSPFSVLASPLPS